MPGEAIAIRLWRCTNREFQPEFFEQMLSFSVPRNHLFFFLTFFFTLLLYDKFDFFVLCWLRILIASLCVRV